MIYGSKEYNQTLNWRYSALSFINYIEGKKNVAEIIYYQLAFKCGLMTLHYKFKSELF